MAKKKNGYLTSRTEIQNAIKTLYANIRFMSPDNPIKTMVLTSSVPNEGKSTISINLAQAIATSGKKVLLVEADMRRRSLANMLQVQAPHGAYSLISGQVKLDGAIVSTQTKNLFFLDMEPGIPSPADILSSKRYAELVDLLAETFEYVIFDTPPVGTFVDAAILSTLVDGTLLVVRPKFTKRKEVQDAYDQLQKAGANVLGAVTNFCESTGSEYYYAYYSNEGERLDSSTLTNTPSNLPRQSGAQNRAIDKVSDDKVSTKASKDGTTPPQRKREARFTDEDQNENRYAVSQSKPAGGFVPASDTSKKSNHWRNR